MKKILTIALVALLVASTAFAGFSGKAKLSLGYNTATGAYGFNNGNEFSLDIDLSSETAEKAAEGDIYAGIKATMALKAADRTGANGAFFVKGAVADIGLGFIFSVKEAYIAGQDWKVSITGTQDGPDFAESAIDKEKDYSKDSFGNQPEVWWNETKVAKSWAVDTFKAPGVTATYKDWKLALGFAGGKEDKKTGCPDYFNYHASLFTPEFTLVDGLTVKAAAVASGVKSNCVLKDGTGVYKNETYMINGLASEIKWLVSDEAEYVYSKAKNYDAFGASAQIAYVADSFSAKLAADFGMKKTMEDNAKFKPGFDLAANAVAYGITVDAYYQYGEKKQWISAQVKADLNTYEVPVVLTVYGKNMADDEAGQTFGGEVATTISAVTAKVGGSYTVSSKELGLSGSVEYKASLFTAKAGLNFSKVLEDNGAKKMYANASVESDVIVPGATLSLGYGPNSAKGKTTTNFFDDKAADYGSVTASCTIKF